MDNSSVPKTAFFGSGKFPFLDRNEDRRQGGLCYPRDPLGQSDGRSNADAK